MIQAKTGRRVQLPLRKEVGWTVIDYAAGERVSAESAVQRPLPVPFALAARDTSTIKLGTWVTDPLTRIPPGHRKLSSHPERPRTGPHLHGDRHRQHPAGSVGNRPATLNELDSALTIIRGLLAGERVEHRWLKQNREIEFLDPNGIWLL